MIALRNRPRLSARSKFTFWSRLMKSGADFSRAPCSAAMRPGSPDSKPDVGIAELCNGAAPSSAARDKAAASSRMSCASARGDELRLPRGRVRRDQVIEHSGFGRRLGKWIVLDWHESRLAIERIAGWKRRHGSLRVEFVAKEEAEESAAAQAQTEALRPSENGDRKRSHQQVAERAEGSSMHVECPPA